MFKSSVYQKRSSLGYHRSVQPKTSQNNARHSPRNGQERRRSVQSPGLNTSVCPVFVYKTLVFQKLLYEEYWIDIVLKFQRGGWWNMTLAAVEAVQAVSKSPAAVSVRISTGERQGFRAAALLSTRASSLKGRAGGSAFMPKLVEHVGPASTRAEELLSPCFACSAAASSVRLRVLVSGFTSVSMARRGCWVPCSSPAQHWFFSLVFSISSSSWSK